MTQPSDKHNPNGFFHRYKELIVTTIICLFLTGIYDSINNQTAEIKKWYQLMIGISEKVKLQADHLGRLEKNLENHVENTNQRFENHNRRIRAIEFDVIPYNIHRRQPQPITDSTHAKDF